MVYLIIYLIGFICTMIYILHIIAKEDKEIIVMDVLMTLGYSLLSWVGFLITIIIKYKDSNIWKKVIWKKKENYE